MLFCSYLKEKLYWIFTKDGHQKIALVKRLFSIQISIIVFTFLQDYVTEAAPI